MPNPTLNRLAPSRLDTAEQTSRHSAKDPFETRRFPGWRWVAVALAFPIAGYIGWGIGGRVNAVDAALVGGAITGAGLGAVEWWAAKGALGRAATWIGASAIGYGLGLAAGAALVGYDTDLGSLALMGVVSGIVLGGAQGLVLAREGRRELALPWMVGIPVLFGLGWCASAGIGVDVDDQWTVFGAAGAVLFMLLSGLLVARFAPTPRHGE
jgi:hypothetical protein